MKTSCWKNKIIPGDNLKILTIVYTVSAIFLTGITSLRYFSRFIDVGALFWAGCSGKTKYLKDYYLLFDEQTMTDALDNIFVGSTIFFLFCILMIVRNYFFFHEKSKSIYLMKRLPDSGELHSRCLTIPVIAILADGLLTAILLIIYVLYYYNNVFGGSYQLNLWEVFI